MADTDLRTIRRISGPSEPDRLTMILPLPPSVNSLYRTVRGRIIKSEEYRLYILKARDALFLQQASYHKVNLKGRLEVWLWLMLADRRRHDVSNMVKAIEDVVSDYLGYDDKLHDVMHLYKALDRNNPRAVFVLKTKEKRIPEAGDIG